jgi:hypothetical protein
MFQPQRYIHEKTMDTIDRSPALNIEVYVFPRETWKFFTDGRNTGIDKDTAKPGTWCLPCEGVSKSTLGFFRCPNCKEISVLDNRVHRIDQFGKVTQSLQCKYKGCSFHRKCYLDKWNDKPLYACAVVRNGVNEIHYMHARNQAEARLHLGAGDYKIVGIGLAIGHHNSGDTREVIVPSEK